MGHYIHPPFMKLRPEVMVKIVRKVLMHSLCVVVGSITWGIPLPLSFNLTKPVDVIL